MHTPSSTLDDQQLVERMNAIRNSSERHVAAMHHEAGRLMDWREHVRAQPLLAVGAATLLGYTLMSRGKSTHSETKAASEESNAVTAKASVASGAMAFVGSMASSMLRQYVSGYVKNQFAGVTNDRPSPIAREENVFNR